MIRSTAITLRALPTQRDLIDRASGVLGMRRSDFILEAACDRAHNVLLDRTRFELDQARFAQFNELLDVPPVPNVGLERLLRLQVRWNKG